MLGIIPSIQMKNIHLSIAIEIAEEIPVDISLGIGDRTADIEHRSRNRRLESSIAI